MISKDKDWWRQASIYQIYPRSFKDSNGDGLGDIRGIISKADYLASLSLDAVWLSPHYPSALADGGYDVDDYTDVDPRLGTVAEFEEMLDVLHERNIRVFVDIVPNHSSNRHKWFVEALNSPKGSPARDRYIFRDGRGPNGELAPNHWPSHFAPSAWTRTEDGQWYMHLFAPEQPDFNWDNQEVIEEFHRILRFWSDLGVDGFRIDVAHALKKDLSEPYREFKTFRGMENPMTGDHVLFDRNEVHEIYRGWRKIFNEYDPPRVAVAEAYVRKERRMQYATPEELGQAFNFDLMQCEFDADDYKKVITDNVALAKTEGSSSTWVLGNHDVVRPASKFGLPSIHHGHTWLLTDGKRPNLDPVVGLERAIAAALVTFALPGAVYVYNGEELGLPEVPDLAEKDLQDPTWFRNPHTEKGRDGCRVPLPWTKSGSSYGFGDGGAHLPQPSHWGNLSVEAQDGVAGSTLETFRAALKLRRELQSDEEIEWITTTDSEVLHFARPNGWHSITNFNGLPYPMPAGKVLISSRPLVDGKIGPRTTVWLKR